MNTGNRQQVETLLLETILSGLDARESAGRAGSTMLVYLADMLVERARQELDRPDLVRLENMPGPTADAFREPR